MQTGCAQCTLIDGHVFAAFSDFSFTYYTSFYHYIYSCLFMQKLSRFELNVGKQTRADDYGQPWTFADKNANYLPGNITSVSFRYNF